MRFPKTGWKRLVSTLLALAMTLSLLPTMAFAAGFSDQENQDEIKISALHRKMSTDNTSVTTEALSPKDDNEEAKLSPPNHITKNNWPAETRENNTIDVYVTSTDMTEEEKASHAIPYVIDENNVKWYLYQILWTNNPSSDTEGNYGTVMSSDEIVAAAEGTETNEYRFDLTEISAEPNSSKSIDYCIRYCWTLVDPDFWDENLSELEVYHVSYDFNLPENVTTCYTVIEDGIPRPVEGDGNLTQVKGDLEDLAANVYAGAGQNYTVSDFEKVHRDYVGFLVFNNQMPQYTYDEYYEFDGWTVGTDENQKVYEIGAVIPGIEELSDYADENNNIKFTAKWKHIEPLSETELAVLLNGDDDGNGKLPLNLIVKGENVSTTNLMVQWTDEDKNEHSNAPGQNTGDIVTLDKDGQIHYRVTATIDSGFTSAAGAQMKEEFADLTITIHIDDKLEFVTNNGQVTLTVDPGPLKLKDNNWSNISDAQKENNTITFASNNLPEDGDIELYFEWNPDGNNAAPINITGLDFQLKDTLQADKDFNIECWANISGTLNHYDQTVQNPRYHYEAVWTALNSERSWQEAFPGGLKSPSAFIHALQFMDAKLKDFDLRADDQSGDEENGTAPLIKTSANAVIVESTPVTLTPANMTIYMGGNGGYDAVVDENGNVVESANSLPHPIFQLTAPDGVGFSNQTFTNADSGNTWKLVQETGADNYYHFENEGSTNVGVRVQYSDGNNVVTSDEFEPETNVYKEYNISVYKGNTKGIVTAVGSDGKNYLINTGTGTLTVRAVEAADPTSDVVVGAEGADLVPAEEQVPAANEAVALVPAGTTYTLNGLEGVTLPQDAKPSLLFDDIIKSDGVDRETPLKDATDTALGGAAGDNVTRTYQTKYLDLVDANNGNAWIKASDNVTIYWGYPEGTDQNTEFKIVHFKDLHRDGENSGFDPADINAGNTEVLTVGNGLTLTDQGIKFEVTPGNFSPYVLVWDVDNTPDPGPGPDPDTPVGPVHPVDPTPELERGDHYAYIVGYEDDTIRPKNNITRAEVATIFFRLLTDESREAYFTTDQDFTDVNDSAWYANTVATLSNAGILAGYPDGSFRPNDPITRAEFAAIATRFDDLATADSTFTDIDGHWAEDAINAAYGAGWVGGYPDGTFRPNNNITRAEVMSLVNRVLDREVDEDGMLDDMLTWTDNEPGTWYYEAVQEATNSHDYEREDVDSLETWTQINEPIDWDKVEDDLLNN